MTSPVAHPQAVYQHAPCRDFSSYCALLPGKFQNLPVLADEDVFLRHSKFLRQFRVFYQMAVFSVNRHEKFRPDKIMNEFDFLLAGMARNVDAFRLAINNIGS